ncbi:metal ABC transporter permease [Sulfitobacter donghicola]|uniref:Membrane protein n=1 Tax=Sulfitobacter donghicola DSW-25 = KCTC 12864 = JCM 14565 TaxID=1300350 RepID=A0A073IJS4_9RHOB|nr:metal ABC transporter permease [Sulfitobacter donghicola]KEJ90528.1 membrane protein [Sulfitobacter donghicola DSW-25 = KCTC 12864 = JCM 14565]KIN67770.1 putative iron transport system membrane abc transporter protein [Sulfitobacter donghicola DSW-25 = KCTC 12864 = JCM 14565]
MIETLLQPFQFAFMQNAFVMVLIIAVPTSLLSCYLVLKGWSLMGDAISHAVLPGVVAAYMLGLPLIIGAFVAGMFCALATGFLSENSRVKQDTVMGIVFSGMFGFGIVMYTKVSTDVHLDHILFGNMLGVGSSDLWTAGLIALFVGAIVIAKRRDLMLHAFDPVQAQAVGLRVGWLHYGLLALISLTIVATLSAVGIILSIGLLIAPGAIAFLLTQQFARMLPIAVGVTMLSGFLGVYASFYLDSAPAPTIILILTAIFIAAFIKSNINTRRATT